MQALAAPVAARAQSCERYIRLIHSDRVRRQSINRPVTRGRSGPCDLRPNQRADGMLQRHDRTCDEDWLLECYLDGWAEVKLAKILDAAAPDYHYSEPLVGRFSWSSLPQYFELVRGRFARTGAIVRQDLAFIMRVPVHGLRRRTEDSRMFRCEAPRIGLTGMAWIVVGPCGVIAEHVAYDLNLASMLLRE